MRLLFDLFAFFEGALLDEKACAGKDQRRWRFSVKRPLGVLVDACAAGNEDDEGETQEPDGGVPISSNLK